MQAQAHHFEGESGAPEGIGRAQILEIVTTLREDVSSLATDIQVVLKENVELRREVDKLRERRQEQSAGGRLAEVQRIRQELDQLMRLHEATSSRRTAPPSASRRERSTGDGSSGGTAWLKKMMMFMMMAELV